MYKDGIRAEKFIIALDPEHGIQMKPKELPKTFMILKW